MDTPTTEIAEIDKETTLPVPVDTGTAMFSMIERLAMDASIPLERLEKIMDMQERVEAKNAKVAFSKALAAAKSEMLPVLKNQKNNQTHSTYADLGAIDKTISPVISRHGFSMAFFPTRSNLDGHYGVDCTLSHADGHEKNYHIDIPADGAGLKGNANKTPTHAFGSSMSYGRRYLKMMIFDIATTDDDGNGATIVENITESQVKIVRDLIDETGSDIAAFCKYLKVSSLAEIPMNKFGEAEAALINKRTQENG